MTTCTETTETDEFVFEIYAKHDAAIPEGYHAGTITDLKSLGKRVTEKYGEKDEIAIVVTLDETFPDGRPMICKVKFNRTIAEGSNLRHVLMKFGFMPDNRRFDLATIKGLRVDVYVRHRRGKVRGKTFGNVDWKDIDLPGRRKMQAVEIERPAVIKTMRSAKTAKRRAR